MRRTNVIILLVAILIGGVAAFMAKSWIERNRVVAPQGPTKTIVVAAAPIGFGTELSKDNVTEIPWAAPKLPEGAFATRDELLKDGRRVVLAPMDASELVLRSKVTGPGQRASLSALLEEGKRAVTVRVDDIRGVAGFVLPGDRVDVVLIRMGSGANGANGGNESFSDILLEHVRVLAIDQLANERQERPTVAKAVTLEVTPEQAQKLLLASNIGKLSLVLRQAGEAHQTASRRITEQDLGFAEARKKAEPAATSTVTAQPSPATPSSEGASQPRSSTVVVFHGMKREAYAFRPRGEEESVYNDDSPPTVPQGGAEGGASHVSEARGSKQQ